MDHCPATADPSMACVHGRCVFQTRVCMTYISCVDIPSCTFPSPIPDPLSLMHFIVWGLEVIKFGEGNMMIARVLKQRKMSSSLNHLATLCPCH